MCANIKVIKKEKLSKREGAAGILGDVIVQLGDSRGIAPPSQSRASTLGILVLVTRTGDTHQGKRSLGWPVPGRVSGP